MLDITKEELYHMIHSYFTQEVESCPLNAQAFIDVTFHKYEEGWREKESKTQSEDSCLTSQN